MVEVDSPSEIDPKAIAVMAYQDPVFFCRWFLEHLFPTPMPWVHRGLLAILTRRSEFLATYGDLDKIRANFVSSQADGPPRVIFNEDMSMNLGKYTLVELPRGFSKTTIAGVAVPLYNILFQEVPFTVYVSHAAPHSKMQLNNIKRELTDNRRLLAVFGDVRPGQMDDQKWSEEFFETTTRVACAARGRGGQIRGLNHLGQRPKVIICDDLEDQESVATEDQREKVRRWAYGDLMPALPELDPEATIVALGTLLHGDSLLETWARDPIWTAVKMGALDVDGEPLWPEQLDEEKLELKKQSFATAGQLHTFYMEYFNKAVSPELQIFKPEHLVHATPPTEGLRCATYCDPAISDKAWADYTVILTAGMDAKGIIWVLDVWCRRGAAEREKVDEFFRQVRAWGGRVNGVESVAYQAALVHLLREEMFRQKTYFEIVPVTHKTKKVDRIRGVLAPRFANAYIRLARRFPELEAQLLDFPSGKHDDAPDALAGAVALLDPYAASAAGGGPDGSEDLDVDSYESLGEWRWA